MAVLQEMDIKQIDEAIINAAERRIPVTVTVASGQTWHTLHSRIIKAQPPHFHLEMPVPDDGAPPHAFSPAEKIGVSFKLRHHKHVSTVTLAAIEQLTCDGGPISALSLCWPAKMQRLQRRAYFRAEVPPNRIVRASFWLGGRAAEPAGTSPERPVWSGQVANLSAGGFQLVTDGDIDGIFEVGEAVGVRLAFGASREVVYADAQFRHIDTQDQRVMMGFQFVGLGHTPEGRHALDIISAKVSQFQHAAEHGVAMQRRQS